MTENIFQQGCLVQLSVSKWGGVRRINKSKLVKMVDQAENNWVTATKKLVDPASLKPICKISGAARNWLTTVSLPFPLNGMLFIPRDLINQVDERLIDYKIEFNQAVQNFILDYSRLRETAKEFLAELFSEVDYPVNIGLKFNFDWRFITLDVPNGETGILSPELYAKEKEKLVQTMQEAREMAVAALREEFCEMIEKATERFTNTKDGKPKIFRNSAVDNFYSYFETFQQRNIFKDQELSEMVDRARNILGNASADDIRSNTKLKRTIQSGMAEIETVIETVLNRPRRKIVMD